ncbi:MAG: energy coupling factor transporter S component ThiW [Lachnospiraceae bacterium]|nr:energy coupling factor transporter S component ThiW [Lachnospiraceae bacterium]
MRQNSSMARSATQKLALAGVFTAVAVAGSFISFPIAGSKCAPVQHMVNILAAVLLGPGWGVGMAFCSSLIRNLTGLGSLMAFPGSMVGALCCGLMYKKTRNLLATSFAEAIGTGFLGGLCAYPVAKLLMGIQSAGAFAYIVPFLISTVAGSILAFVLLGLLEKSGVLKQMQTKLTSAL